MSPKKARKLQTIRGLDVTLRYTSDDQVDCVINQRQFFDEDGVMLAPITPKLLQRQVQPGIPSIPRLGDIKPRVVMTCFGSLINRSGESNFTVIVPYAPGDANHGEHLNELFNYISPSVNLSPPTALDVSYYGESKL